MKEMNIVYMHPEELTPYPANAKQHPGEQVQHIANSIREFGFRQPIVVDADNVVVIGHGRLMAAKQLGLDSVPVLRADDLTDEQIRALRLADNKTNESEWDFELLEAELAELELDFDMTDFGFDEVQVDIPTVPDDEAHAGALAERYVVPPFSVLDARQGYWQDRKRQWLEITGDLSETRDGEFGKISGPAQTIIDSINGGTSNFDPVLAEVMYKWFCVPGGHVLDPFGGEQTKGVVAGELGYRYTGCEIRPEQCTLNREQTSRYTGVRYVCGDSNDIMQHIAERDFDMLFTSPPYYDLEVYSKEDMSALGTYDEFMAQYRNIFTQCFSMLRDGAFAVVKVGEIRDKKTGQYRCFVADNVKLMEDIGFKFYNDLVLITAIGTAQLRANNSMQTRKVVKCHQNVLVFYKGDLKGIQARYPRIDFGEAE